MECYYCGRVLDPIMKAGNIEVFDLERDDWVYACPPGYIRECHQRTKTKEEWQPIDQGQRTLT